MRHDHERSGLPARGRGHGHEARYRPASARSGSSGSGGVPDGLLLGGLALLLGVTVLTWTSTGLAGLLSHGAWPDGLKFTSTPVALRELAADPQDLAGAWPAVKPSHLSGYGLFWGLFIGQLLVLAVFTVFVLGTVVRARAVRAARRATYGDTDHPDVRKPAPGGPYDGSSGLPGEAPADPGALPPAAHTPAVNERAMDEGTVQQPAEPAAYPSAGTAHPASPEAAVQKPADATGTPHPVPGLPSDSSTTDTDPRHRIQQAPGAVLVTTSDPDLWAATKSSRAKLGPVHLFDPGQLCDTPDRLRWSPHHGCADRSTAAARATALLAPLRSPRPIDGEVHATAETLLRCWLHAAALDDKPFREVHRWAHAKSVPTDPVQTLRTHPKASSGAAGELEAALTGHPERRREATGIVRSALSPLSQLHVRNACTAARADRVSLESFIDETGTLYVVGEDEALMPILNALTQSVVEHGRRVAARSSAGRLDPPLTTVLELPLGDEPLSTPRSRPQRLK